MTLTVVTLFMWAVALLISGAGLVYCYREDRRYRARLRAARVERERRRTLAGVHEDNPRVAEAVQREWEKRHGTPAPWRRDTEVP